jgi:ubiquinone/menaquinone biosynthesis C-methylase UbiE
MQLQWIDFDLPFIRQRYNRVAKFFIFFEWLFLLPPGIRRKAVRHLELKPGDRVLEVGCGTGRNLSLLRDAVGQEGHVYGVDLSEGMLAMAQELCTRQNWDNVTLIRSDAAEYAVSQPVDGVLFSLSYNTMPHHREVLQHAWQQVRPGGHLVIMDAKLPPGIRGKLLLPYSVWIMKRTVLGNPYILPWEELHELANDFEMEEFLLGSYYICRGKKPHY